jgi:hypothetical protein
MQEGIRWIKADPGRWLALIPKKLGYTFDHESFPMGYLGEANPASWPPERQALGRTILTASHAAFLALAALAFVGRPRIDRLAELVRRGRRDGAPAGRAWMADLVQLAVLLAVLGLTAVGILGTERILWPLAVAIPVLAALPIPGAPARGGVLGYLAFAVATVCVTHAVFFGEDRYHIVTTPVICVLVACALRRPEGALETQGPGES